MEHKQLEAYVDAMAAALALPLLPEHRPGVLTYFALAASFAELVNAQPLRIDDEAAPVFTPLAPGDVPAAAKGRLP